MTKKLVIAEKPSVAEDIAKYLESIGEGKARKVDGSFNFANYIVTSARGHLLEQVPPEAYDPELAKWWASRAKLPFIPGEFKLAPIADGKSYLNCIKANLGLCSSVINAGDNDEEGQLLIDEILYYLGNKKPVERLTISGKDLKNIGRGFKNLKDNAHFLGWYETALFRSHADWAYGLNATRTASIYGSRKLGQVEGKPISLGRVQTPTLGLLVNNYLNIKNFKSVDYFTPWIDAEGKEGEVFRMKWEKKEDDIRVDPDGRLLDISVANAISASCKGKTATVKQIDYRPGSEQPTAPMSLLQAQSALYDELGVAGDRGLEILQSLYDKKLTSYPRTDCRDLPDDQFGDAAEVLESIKPFMMGGEITGADPKLKSKAWKAIENHHAILPIQLSAENMAAFKGMSGDERVAYTIILKSYIRQFYPAATVLNTEIIATCEGETFKAKSKQYLSYGWMSVFNEEKPNTEVQVPGGFKAGDLAPVVDGGTISSKTSPPKPFNEVSLMEAMEAIHLYVSDPKIKASLKEGEGIGTSATRASIIKTLFDRGYAKNVKKTMVPTELGIALIQSLPKELTLPDMTAGWQMVMSKISRQEASYADTFDKQKAWIVGAISGIKVAMDALPGGNGNSNPNRPPVTVDGHTEGESCPTCAASAREGKLVAFQVNKDGPNKGKLFLSCSAREAAGCDFMATPWSRPGANTANREPVIIGEHKEGAACPTCASLGRSGKLMAFQVNKEGANKGKFFLSCDSRRDTQCDFMAAPWNLPKDESELITIDGHTEGQACPHCVAAGRSGKIRAVEVTKEGPNKGAFFLSCSGWRDGCKFQAAPWSKDRNAIDFVRGRGAGPRAPSPRGARS